MFSLISKTQNFTERQAIRLMKQVVSAVLYCHINGIVHRDIKSDNILFTGYDINSPLKLIDFGISVKFERDTKLKDKTGTVLYIAPEVIAGSYNEKCDIWSLGVLLYMMLCGQPPFYASTRKEIMEKIVKGRYQFKGKIWNVISPEAKDLISQMLTLNPSERPSCREVLSHTWFNKDEVPTMGTALYLDNMRKHSVGKFNFKISSQLIQAVLTFIATNLIHHKDTKELEAAFKRLDVNQDGRLSKAELTAGFQKIYPHYDDLQIKALVNEVFENADFDMSGQIDYTEYLISAMNKQILVSRDKLQKAFLAFDLVIGSLRERRRLYL